MSDTNSQTGVSESTFSDVVFSLRSWWSSEVVGTVDQKAVIEKRREDCLLSARYLLMLSMSAGIAILGLLLSSPAVVIGAMLLSPLMGPIMGLGFGLAIGDFSWTKQSAKSLFLGSLLSILFCALIVFLSPIQTVTSEIAARTQPNLFDLLVALFSGIAGTYAMIRGREGTIVGVAIATALMPPLAVVGFGLATFNWTVFGGALMLFVTNLVTIAATAFGLAKLYGFRTALTERQTRLQFGVTLFAFVALAIPLGLSLVRIANESRAQGQIRGAVLDSFAKNSRLSDLQINWDADPVIVTATVLTPRYQPRAEATVDRAVERIVGDEVQVTLTQVEVGVGQAAAERAQLAAAQEQEEASVRRANELARQLGLVAGVPDDDVVVDRQRRHAMVRADRLEGASLGTYRILEQRIAATEPEWSVEILPPISTLPPIPFEQKPDGEEGSATMAPTAKGAEALATTLWAAQRIGAPVELSGPVELLAFVRRELEAAGVVVRDGAISRNGSVVTPSWSDASDD
ncbi:TIGR00341 family protein [Altererythrobacter arenosus]|uniref:TIGR00341 family protein n=1 Tax=Altererythrobacter arenosus TaxID=3032592 RepID=A0ABY8FTA4_9SPHN|nr:TIGR00341 family protein [Altererythrobacter sp. CAU 1644]WFL78251.1 TIGR00341 family protein [Altererythrobacter sp. CAU 1644]